MQKHHKRPFLGTQAQLNSSATSPFQTTTPQGELRIARKPLYKLGESEATFICSGAAELKRREKSEAMAAVSKDQKANVQKKRRMKRQTRPQKTPAKQSKLPSGPRRNICHIRLPKSCHLQSCPLMSWCFNKQVRDNVLSLRMPRCTSDFWAAAYRRMTMQAGGQKKQDCCHVSSDFLKATVKAMDKRRAKQKRALAEKTAKPRRRYSDKEIFYRLAKPSALNDDVYAGPSGRGLDAAGSVPAFPQPLAGTPQPVVA
ncbi:UNVERIFIED_CONTAM: hypothetical protein K2H54_025101 [Gekko kuhli]